MIIGVRVQFAHLHHVEHRVSNHLAEYGVLSVEVVCGIQRNEELTVVCVWLILVCHGNDAAMAEFQPRADFVLEGSVKDGFASLE